MAITVSDAGLGLYAFVFIALSIVVRGVFDACNVANLFSHLNDIQASPECCPPGGCVSGFPGTADACSVDCGESAPNAPVLHCHSPAGLSGGD